MKKIISVLILTGIVLLSGCSTTSNSDSKKTQDDSSQGFLSINQKKDVDYIQHLKGNNYELGFVNTETKELMWIDTEFDLTFALGADFKVYLDEKVSKSYLVRYPNETNGTPLYVLHISKKNEINAGVISETCGKGCTDTYQSEMISK